MKRRINHLLLIAAKEKRRKERFQNLNKIREAGEPFDRLITVRNEVAGRLYFHRCVSVILFTGGRGCLLDTP